MEGLNIHLVFAIIAAALGAGFQHGYHTGVINVPAKVFDEWINKTISDRSDTPITKSTSKLLWGLTTSIINIGGTIGGLVSGVYAGYLGPKTGLLFNNILVTLACVLMTFSYHLKSFEMLVAGRFVIGMAAGLCACLCPVYVSEISPVNMRGALGSVYQLVITISILIAQVVGMEFAFGSEKSWPFLFLIPLIFVIHQVVCLPFAAESPNHLLTKSKDEKAEKAIKWLRKSEDVKDELTLLKTQMDAVKAQEKVTLKNMIKDPALRKPLIISLMIMLAQQLSGINAVIFYSTYTFKSAGLSQEQAQYATLGIGTINVLMTLVSLVLVDIAGRKTLLLIGFFGMAVDTACLTIALHFANEAAFVAYFAIAAVFIYIILFAAGAGSIPWFIVSELFDQSARGTAVSLAVPANWIANFLVTLTFPLIELLIGPFVFLIFATLDILFCLFILKFVPETKNKTIEEITALFKQ